MKFNYSALVKGGERRLLVGNVLIFLVALLLVMLPILLTAVFSVDSIVATNLKKVFFILYGISFFALLFAFIRPKLLLILLTPVLLVSFVEIYILLSLRSGVTQGLFASFFSTNAMEVHELLMSNKTYLLLAAVVLIGYVFLILKIEFNYRLPLRLRAGSICFFLLVQTVIVLRDVKISWRYNPDERLEVIKYSSVVKLSKTFPVNWGMHLSNYLTRREELANYAENLKGFKFGAIENEPTCHPKLIVMVIGETARRDNFSLYGYERKTNPLLGKESNLIVMNNAEAVLNTTSQVYPVFLSRATKDDLSIGTKEPSVIKAFSESGYKTVYINNQNLGYGSIYYQYAHQADTLIDLKPSMDVSCNDEPILSVFNDLAMGSLGNKVFVVIHSLGSHFRYNLRYPENYEVFKPSIDNDLDLANINNGIKEELRNSYDNSILFTDHFLAGLISIMKKDTSTVSLMMYASDHGENIFDDAANRFAHGGSEMTKYEKEIPLLIWRSDSYDQAYGAKIRNVLAHVNAPINTSNFFHSILDLSGVVIDNQTLSMSFATENFPISKTLTTN